MNAATMPAKTATNRVDGQDWPALVDEVNRHGCAPTGPLLTPTECAEIAGLYAEADRFRSTIDLQRHTLAERLDLCHDAGQTKPTPILLRYQEGDWNALHRDLYGDLVFPLQAVIGLNEPGVDHTGGEFLTLEQRPRAQSRGIARVLEQGHGLIFTTRERPVESTRGWSQAPMRHGVSEVRSGIRHTLGLAFHDAT